MPPILGFVRASDARHEIRLGFLVLQKSDHTRTITISASSMPVPRFVPPITSSLYHIFIDKIVCQLDFGLFYTSGAFMPDSFRFASLVAAKRSTR